VKWEGGSVRNLGWLAGYIYSSARQVTNNGLTVGLAIDEAHGPTSRESKEEVGVFDPQNTARPIQAKLFAANDVGDSVAAVNVDGRFRLILRSGKTMRTLHIFNPIETPYNLVINDRKQVAATVHTADGGKFGAQSSRGEYVAAWLDASNCTILPAIPGYPDTYCTDINNEGQIVGTARDQRTYPPRERGVMWTGASVIDLTKAYAAGTDWVITRAGGINDHGDIAGSGTEGTVRHAVLVHSNGDAAR